jgi:hypothetical protein
MVSGVSLSLWQAGYFLVKSGKESYGFGIFKMNLVSLINPYIIYPLDAPSGPEKWSYILPSLPTAEGAYEGFNYLGLGIIIILLISAPKIKSHLRHVRLDFTWLPLIIACCFLALFAITNHIGFGARDFTIPIPDKVTALASVFRCSGRMFWPVYYLLIWFLLSLFIRNYNRNTAIAMLAFAVIIQAVDTRAGWEPRRQKNAIAGETWNEPFKSPFWEIAASRYKKIRVFPAGRSSIHQEVSHFAARHKMPTDAAYLARFDSDKLDKLNADTENILYTGNYEPHTLYIIHQSHAQIAIDHLKNERDLDANIDGYFVVAPQWD